MCLFFNEDNQRISELEVASEFEPTSNMEPMRKKTKAEELAEIIYLQFH